MEKNIPQSQLGIQPLDIVNKLKLHNIPFNQWGTDKTKTVDHLAKEIINGEAKLVEKDGKIIRKIEAVSVKVQYTSNGIKLQLVEDKEIFKNGRERRRGLIGVSEKMETGENPMSSAKRALNEELGLDCKSSIEFLSTEKSTRQSNSYPGIQNEYVIHKMHTTLQDCDFKPEGYVEKQEDKSTFFVWKELNNITTIPSNNPSEKL